MTYFMSHVVIIMQACLYSLPNFFNFFHGLLFELNSRMGTLESCPNPLIDHLRQTLNQPQEHKWRNSPVWLEGVEPGTTSSRPHLRADCHWWRICFWQLFLLVFFSKPRTWVSIFIYFWLSPSTVKIFLALQSVKCQPNHTALYICWLNISQINVCILLHKTF